MSYHVEILDDYYLSITLLVTIGFQFIFFIITALLKFDKLTDFAGGTNFLLLALLTFFLGGTFYVRQIIDTLLVALWAFRLAGFLFFRIIKWGEDNRFDEIRENIFKLAFFWTLQAIWVWTVSLPLTILNSDEIDENLTAFDYIGWALFLIGLGIETISDFQKLFYKQKVKDHWCDVGLWSWSRHPNYFGEILLWFSLFMSVANILSGWEWLVIVSPLFITFLLLFVSGIPIQERTQQKRYCESEKRDEFLHYKHRTSTIIPFPPALYEKIPRVLKIILFLDFPFYSPNV
mmetsp:Transcript_10131/g.17333  ORF Transcript_10131/g.17333 Transcript_10131/m.17333 type:complete len:290 (+) Transcript_10131:15-884(+)